MTILGQEGNSRDHQQLSWYYNQYDKKEREWTRAHGEQ